MEGKGIVGEVQEVALTSEEAERVVNSVNRADFLPPEFKTLANEDMPIPIALGITVPTQALTALELDLLELESGDSVLEIGTGSGYQTAILASAAHEVVSIEIGRVEDGVLKLLPESVTVFQGKDGRFGPWLGPIFDAVLVTAGTDALQTFWVNSLKEGGRLVVPIGRDPNYELRKYRKFHGEMRDCGTFAYLPVVPLRG